jgi:hypothetical protein
MELGSIIAGASLAGRLIHTLATNEETKSTVIKLWRSFKLRRCKYISVIIEDLTRGEMHLDVDDSKYVVLNVEKILFSMNSDQENEMIGNLKINNNDLYCLQVYKQLKPIIRALRRQYSDKTCVILLSSKRLCELLHLEAHMTIYTMTDRLFEEATSRLDETEKRFHQSMRKVHKPIASADYDTVQELKRLLGRQFQ